MDKLPSEGRALVAQYYANLRRYNIADIDAEIINFEAAV
jgi:hypothetical protein